VALPGDELYEKGCRVWNGAVRRHPAIIAFCGQPEDVQAAVRAARRHGLPLSVRGGGHDWAGRALRDDGLVVDLTGMRDVAVDAQALVATVGRGARAKDVAIAAGAHNLVAAMGNCGTVGMAGLSLGGGYGPLSGTCGLAADNLLGAEIVLADGRRVTTGPNAERPDFVPDLIGIAFGAFADPSMSRPTLSVWETTRHPWVTFDHERDHFVHQPELIEDPVTARR
jgi:FAD/FMN-containing dehydrogenase